jgi:hypothetical protein
MIRTLSLLAILALFHAGQDVFVATWSTGAPDSDNYESLSFWIKDNQRAYIRYAHGKDAESTDVSWLGADSVAGMHGFRISSPNPATAPLFVIPKGDSLHIVGGDHYDRFFHWENENDSTGETPCSICARSGKQAMGWLRRYFF